MSIPNSIQLSSVFYIDLLAPVFFCLFVTLILPRVKTLNATILSVALLGSYLLVHKTVLHGLDIRFETLLPLSVLIGGYGIVMFRRILARKKEAREVLSDPSGSDRTLGLFYRQQGLLDLAFEKYRTLPLDNDTKDLIYELACEYEALGQMGKALDAFKLIAGQGRKSDVLPAAGSLVDKEEPGTPSEIESPSDALFRVEVGSTIAGYVISDELAKDSRGKTFRAQDPKKGTSVILRTLSCSRINKRELEDISSRFFHTMESLRQLEHPHVVTPEDFGKDSDMLYVVTRDLEGQDMTRFIQKGHLLPVRDALRIIGLAASSLQCAHEKKIVHQFLRPCSIVMEKHSHTAMVKDFEIAAFVPFTGGVMGDCINPHLYMSPEQVSGKRLDGRSDVFSLGVILFEMLTAVPPFSGEDMASSMLKISKEKHLSPRFFNPKIPRVVETIIDRALEKGLEKRYQKAGQMAAHLNQVVARIDELIAKKATR